jgi:hypothetical protein
VKRISNANDAMTGGVEEWKSGRVPFVEARVDRMS